MKLLIAFSYLAWFLLAGCASKTVVTYTGPDGRSISYESAKEQVGLEVELHQDEKGNIKGLTIKVDKASSDVIAMQNQGKLIDLLGTAVGLAAKAGGGKIP